jgi:hypothetical protein
MRTDERGSVVRRLSLAIILIYAFVASPALAQTADRPNVKVGDEWRFVEYTGFVPSKLNLVWVVTSVTPAGIEGTDNGGPLLLTPDLSVLESSMRKQSDPGTLRFPLEVGKQWSAAGDYLLKDNGARGTLNGTRSVVGYEKVRVLAGEFDAFKLESTSDFKTVGGLAGVSTRTYWYAPAARAIVKDVWRDPYRGVATIELVEFTLRP